MLNALAEVLQEYGNDDKCKIRDPAVVEEKLQKLINGGLSKLQVIADFDQTITRFHKDGNRCTSAHGIIDHSPLMSDDYREKGQAIVKKYLPIELDPNMSNEEKAPHIIKWFRDSQVLLIDDKITEDKIREMAKTGNSYLRDLAHEVLSFLNDHKVPCLIFSAGQGNIIKEILHRENVYFPNVKLVSNFMIFNEQGECVSFKEPLIHIYNKNLSAVDNPQYFQEIAHRNNVLLLGDSLGDVGMDTGVCSPEAVLKIGFLNDKVEERLDAFLNGFDVVLLDDQSFKFADIVLRKTSTPPPHGSGQAADK